MSRNGKYISDEDMQLGRWKWTGFFTILAIVSFLVYQHYTIPDDLIPMGDDSETIARLAMWTAIGSAVASALNVVKSLLDLNKE